MFRINTFFPTLFTIIIAVSANIAYAQDASSLISEGNQLYNSSNYPAAIEKYKSALKLDPDNVAATYRLGFSLNAAGRGKEALPYLEKTVSSNASNAVISSSYALMAAIYDQSAQPEKAIDNYQHAIKLDSANSSLHYSLGLAYFRSHQYSEAEKSAIRAISIDPAMDDAYRLYGLVTFHQDKRAQALLGLCSYLWLMPKGAKSPEACGNIQHILNGGSLKPEAGVKREPLKANTIALNQAITKAVGSAATKKYSTPADRLSSQLNSIFTAVGSLAEKQSDDPFFTEQLARFYYKLTQSPHLKTFACVITQSTDKSAAAWLITHSGQVNELKSWIAQAR